MNKLVQDALGLQSVIGSKQAAGRGAQLICPQLIILCVRIPANRLYSAVTVCKTAWKRGMQAVTDKSSLGREAPASLTHALSLGLC